MIVKQIIDEDFVNYKKASMFIAFPYCSWKCEKDCGKRVCQNSSLANAPNIEIDVDKIVSRYINNPLTSAIVIGGLEPFDSPSELYNLINKLRKEYKCNDDIVIYTGYTEEEIHQKFKIDLDFTVKNEQQDEWGFTIPNVDLLQHIDLNYENIIIKFGRYIPDRTPHYDEVLGVNLASDNQYAKRF